MAISRKFIDLEKIKNKKLDNSLIANRGKYGKRLIQYVTGNFSRNVELNQYCAVVVDKKSNDMI